MSHSLKTLLAIASIFITTQCLAFSLEGSWQSDKAKTLTWNEKNRKMNTEFTRKLGIVLGHHYWTFDKGRICNFVESFTWQHNDETKSFHGTVLPESTYKIIAKNESGFVLEETSNTGSSTIYMLIFESDDSMYGVTLSNQDFDQPGYREYYRRTTLDKPVRWGEKSCYKL